jgi:hypothetical protein
MKFKWGIDCMIVKKSIKKNLLILVFIIFLLLGSIFFSSGLYIFFGLDKDPVKPKQDLQIYRITDFDKDLDLFVEAYLMPEFNLLYSFDEVPVQLKLRLDNCDNCLEIADGIPFWFFYEKIDDSGSGGSYCSNNFYNLTIKPGEEKTFTGWVVFTGEGTFKHGLVDNNLKGYHIRLEATNKNFTVYPNYIVQQLRNNRVINSLTYIVISTSFFILSFTCYQSYSSQKLYGDQRRDFKRLIRKIK